VLTKDLSAMTTSRTAHTVQPDRPDRSVETERAILFAARDLLAEGGLEALSMRIVAERVGLSATAIYHYFEGKDQLVRRVVENSYVRFDEYLQGAVGEEKKGSLDRLLALGEGYVRFAFENQEYFRILYNIQARSPRQIDELPGGGGYHLLRQCVIDAMESGELQDANPDLVAHYLWTCVHGLVTLTLACDLDRACEAPVADVPTSAVQLFRAFEPLLRDGLRPRVAEPGEQMSKQDKASKKKDAIDQ